MKTMTVIVSPDDLGVFLVLMYGVLTQFGHPRA